MSIFHFYCPYCTQKFESEETDAGQKAICPNCKNEIIIPVPPEQRSNIPVLPEPDENPERKWLRCPFCDEEISDAALVCPYCQNDIIRCPKCGAVESFRYCESAADKFKAVGGMLGGALIGNLIWGGAAGAGLGSLWGIPKKLSGYFRCSKCGYILH